MDLAAVIPHIIPYETQLVAIRQKLHKHPELAYKEFATAETILEIARSLDGLSIEDGIAETGIKIVLESARPGPVIALRADMDALPISEQTELPYRSEHAGVMHACGHDGHSTCLLGALLVLHSLRDKLAGPVVFIFQPAEELEFGAKHMVEAGVLKNPDVQAIFGLHAWPDTPLGKVVASSGPVLAGYRDFDFTVRGKGGHAAEPEKSVDPLVIAAQLISALQTVVSRATAPVDALVLTVGRIAGGRGRNVIPEEVTFGGTTRFYKEAVGLGAKKRIEEISTHLVQGMGGEVSIDWHEGVPPVINDRGTTSFFNSLAGDLLSGGEFGPSMASEDFACYLEHVPGTFFGLGIGGCDTHPLHHPSFDFADEALRYGVAMHCLLALNASELPVLLAAEG